MFKVNGSFKSKSNTTRKIFFEVGHYLVNAPLCTVQGRMFSWAVRTKTKATRFFSKINSNSKWHNQSQITFNKYLNVLCVLKHHELPRYINAKEDICFAVFVIPGSKIVLRVE